MCFAGFPSSCFLFESNSRLNDPTVILGQDWCYKIGVTARDDLGVETIGKDFTANICYHNYEDKIHFHASDGIDSMMFGLELTVPRNVKVKKTSAHN